MTAIRRLITILWFSAGFFLLVVLFLPGSLILDILQVRGDVPYGYPEGTTLVLLPSAGMILAGTFVYFGLDRFNENRVAGENDIAGSEDRLRGARTAILALLLGVLLLSKSIHSFYWLMVWDTTYDPLGYLYLIFLLPAAVFTGFVLPLLLPFRKKRIGMVFFLIVKGLLVSFSLIAQSIDYHQLTEARAGRVAQKLEAYHQREGLYPQDLRALIPRYALLLPGPLILYGQGWCYDAGEDYYRLGYVYREHWSDPRLSGRIFKMVGEVSDLPPACVQEIRDIQERYPDYPFSYHTDVRNQ